MENIINQINKGNIIFNIVNNNLRKQIHEYCEKNNLYHLGYYDGTKDEDDRHGFNYFCDICKTWKSIRATKKD